MSNDEMAEGESPFACEMGAIAAERRAGHVATATDLFRSVAEVKELPNGYAFRLPDGSEVLVLAAEFISLERLCCPFFGFALEVGREGGEVWLHLTGRDGVKPFIRAELSEFMSERDRFREPELL